MLLKRTKHTAALQSALSSLLAAGAALPVKKYDRAHKQTVLLATSSIAVECGCEG